MPHIYECLRGTLAEQLAHMRVAVAAQQQALEVLRNSPAVQQVVGVIRRQGRMTTGAVAKALGLSESTVRLYLDRARGLGMLRGEFERVGAGRRMVWQEVQS